MLYYIFNKIGFAVLSSKKDLNTENRSPSTRDRK